MYSYLVPTLIKYSISRLDNTIVNQLKEEPLHGGKRAWTIRENGIRHSFGSQNDSVLCRRRQFRNERILDQVSTQKKKDISVIPPDIFNHPKKSCYHRMTPSRWGFF